MYNMLNTTSVYETITLGTRVTRLWQYCDTCHWLSLMWHLWGIFDMLLARLSEPRPPAPIFDIRHPQVRLIQQNSTSYISSGVTHPSANRAQRWLTLAFERCKLSLPRKCWYFSIQNVGWLPAHAEHADPILFRMLLDRLSNTRTPDFRARLLRQELLKRHTRAYVNFVTGKVLKPGHWNDDELFRAIGLREEQFRRQTLTDLQQRAIHLSWH
jgi:hypothetical protein